MKPAILLFHGKGIISAAIRWQTRSIYSHAALLLPDGRIFEAWQGAGVRARHYPEGPGITTFDVPSATDKQWEDAIEFAFKQEGKDYDYVAIARFLTRENVPEGDTWFCSELVFASMAAAGVNLLERVACWEVSPAMLSMSSLLVKR